MATDVKPDRGVITSENGPVIDPTKNVLDLFDAGSRRADDLREAEEKYFLAEITHLKELIELRALHQREMDLKESTRLDSIRQVDVSAAANTAAGIATAVQTLAASSQADKDAVRALVATTAQAIATQTATIVDTFNKRIEPLERSQYVGVGKGSVAEPQLEKLISVVETLARAQQTQGGKSDGITATTGAIIAAVGFAGSLVYIVVQLNKSPPVPQVVYVPVPAASAPSK